MGSVQDSVGSSNPNLEGFLEEEVSVLRLVLGQEANNPRAGKKKRGPIKAAQWRW